MSRRAQALCKPGDLVQLPSNRSIYNAVKSNKREWFNVTSRMLGLVLTTGPGLYGSKSVSATLLMEGQVISVDLGAFEGVPTRRPSSQAPSKP